MTFEQPVRDPSATRRAPYRPALLLAVAAGLCWACTVGLLATSVIDQTGSVLAPERVIFYVVLLAAALLTFVPAQRMLQLPGLAREGVAGSVLLGYTLAFVPPPTASLIWLPDVPVYMVFGLALFWLCSAIAMPFIYTLGQRVFRQRARQFDLRRSHRQAHEVGAVVALCAGLAGLRVLTPLFVLLVVLIVIVAELLFLSFVEAQSSPQI